MRTGSPAVRFSGRSSALPVVRKARAGPRTRPVVLRRTAVAVAVALTAGACGGGGGHKSDAAATSTTTTSAPAPTTSSSDGGSSTTATTKPSTTKTTVKQAAASPTTASTGTTGGPGPATAPHATVFVAAAPTDPAELDRLGDQLAADAAALRSPATPAADTPALPPRQPGAYRAVAARPEGLPRVLTRLPEALRPIAQANVDAGAELRAMTT